MILPIERRLAKEDKSQRALLWKSSRLSFGADRGLRYGLSGNRVASMATRRLRLSRETALLATGSSLWGNPTRPKP